MNKCNKPTLKEMIIQKDLNMETVFKTIKSYLSKNKNFDNNTILPITNNYNINVFNQIGNILQFSINGENFYTFTEEIPYNMFINEKKYIKLEIISMSQINNIAKENNLNEVLIFCTQCGKKYFNITYDQLKEHKDHKQVCIKESFPIKKLTENDFGKFFKENFKFISKTLNPIEYEPNFRLYFKNSETIITEGKIEIFEDKFHKRFEHITNNLAPINNYESLIQFFGQPGKGKTLSIIGVLKYMMNHTYTGTLYINCKALFNLKESMYIKQLFIDEIPYLFFGCYKDYIQCVNNINNYYYNINTSSFFEIINVIIDYISDLQKKKDEYLLVFDQYNDKVDLDGKNLESLKNKLLIKKSQNLKNTKFFIITFSSMNNLDIRKYKVQYINGEINKKNEYGHILHEINNIEYNLSIDNGGIYDKALKRLGYGLKFFNILKYYYSKHKDENIDLFINKTKSRIRDNLLDFYKTNNDELSNTSNLKILFSFSTDVIYSKDQLQQIINNVPFKYFDIVEGKNSNEYSITFSFPLVGEVINQLYSDIININPSIYTNLTKIELDEGAKGKFFEKIITYYLNIQSSIYKGKEKIELFKDYPINHHKEIDVLVLNKNEKFINEKIKNKLQKGVYLLTQKRYNGKALDIALINISDINEIIGIQISIHKNGIFTQAQVSEFLANLNKNIKNYFDLDVEDTNLYFCYIFEDDNIDSTMIQKCRENGMKYIFFNVTNKSFLDDCGNIIKSLKPYLLNVMPYKKNAYHSILEYIPCIQNTDIKKEEKKEEQFEIIMKKHFDYSIIKGPTVKLSEKQENSIKEIFRKNLGYKNKPILEYKQTLDIFINKLIENENSFCISKCEDIENYDNSIIIIIDSLSNKIIKENGEIYPYSGKYPNIYDYYCVLKNE